jgi:hypothetical protein
MDVSHTSATPALGVSRLTIQADSAEVDVADLPEKLESERNTLEPKEEKECIALHLSVLHSFSRTLPLPPTSRNILQTQSLKFRVKIVVSSTAAVSIATMVC